MFEEFISTLISDLVLLLLFLQLTHVNLNYILCPATVDPFHGPYYRLFAIFHQAICLLTLGKIYTLLIKLALRILSPILPKVKDE